MSTFELSLWHYLGMPESAFVYIRGTFVYISLKPLASLENAGKSSCLHLPEASNSQPDVGKQKALAFLGQQEDRVSQSAFLIETCQRFT